MTAWPPHVVLACALFAGGWAVGPRVERTPAEIARPVLAPLALPFLWRGLARSLREGSTEETIARGQMLLRLLPCWADGHIYLAHILAFQDSTPRPTADRCIDRLLTALALLDDAAELCPRHAVDFRLAQAFFVEFGAAGRSELTTALRRRIGSDPLELADAYLARAEAESTRLQVRLDRAYLTERMIGLALRDGDQARALATAKRAAELLQDGAAALRAAGAVVALENVEAHLASVQLLVRFLAGDRTVDLEHIRADPYLEGITANLPQDTWSLRDR